MPSEIADLYMSLRLVTEGFLAGATEVASAGESMAAKLTASFAEVDAGIRRTGESLGAVATEITAEDARISESFGLVSKSATEMSAKVDAEFEAMAARTAELSTGMVAANARAAESTAAVGAAMESTGAKSGLMGALTSNGMKMTELAAAAVAVVSIKMAADFQTATNKLITSAGESHDAIGMVRDGLLSMAGQVGVSADQLATDLYKIESAGYHGASGLGVLKAAEEGAKAEGADGTKVADALSSALRDYYPKAQSAAEVTAASTDVMSKFIGATSAGKMTFDDLAGSLNNILPISAAANISLTDTLGVLASMTVHGISAQQASENMADAIRHLESPTQAMSKAMATLGVDSNDVAQKLGERGLSGTMQMLSDKVKSFMPPGSNEVILQLGDALSKSTPQVQELGQKLMEGSISMKEFSSSAKDLDPISAKQALAFSTLAGSYHQLGTEQLSGAEVLQTYGGMMQKAMGDATGLKVALMTTGENAAYTNSAIKDISGSTADAAGNVKGWADVQASFNQKLSEFWAGLGALAIQIGDVFLPVLTTVVGWVADFTRWLADNKVAAEIAAAVIGGVLVAALATLTAQTWLWAAALWATGIPELILLITAAIAIVVAEWYFAIKFIKDHWDDLAAFFSGIAAWFKSYVVDPVVTAWHAMVDGIGAAVSAVADVVRSAWGGLSAWFQTYVADPVGSALRLLGKVFSDVWGGVADIFTTTKQKIKSFVDWLHPVFEGIGKVAQWVADTWSTAWGRLTENLATAWGKVRDAVVVVAGIVRTAWNTMAVVAQAAWAKIKPVFDLMQPAIDLVKKAIGFLYDKWIEVWAVIGPAVKAAWDKISPVLGWIALGLLVLVGVFIAMPLVILVALGLIITGLLWLAEKAQDVTSSVVGWVAGMQNDIKGVLVFAAADVKKWIEDSVSMITDGWNTAVGVVTTAWGRISGAIGGAVDWVKGVLSWFGGLPGMFADWFNGARDGANNALDDLVHFVTSIPDRIVSALGNLGGVLVNAGKSLITGLLDGIKSAAQNVYDFVSGIAGKVAALKGPPARDAVLLTPHGQLIMRSLVDGFKAGEPLVRDYLTGLTDSLARPLPVALAGAVSASGLAAAGGVGAGASGAAVTNINVTVQGSLVQQGQIVDVIRTEVLRYAGRNPSAGWTPGLV